MKSIVVDASVVIKWFIPEVHSLAAKQLLLKNFNLLAPDLIFAEIGNVLWKKYYRKELNLETASAILEDFKRLPFESYKSESLLEFAWPIATAYRCTLYDSLYVALAQIQKCLLVTADRILHSNLQHTPLAQHILWVEQIK